MYNIKELKKEVDEIRIELKNDVNMNITKRIDLNYKLYTLNNLIRILKE